MLFIRRSKIHKKNTRHTSEKSVETFCSLLIARYFLLLARYFLLVARQEILKDFFLVKVNKRFFILICTKSLICE